MQQKNDGSLKMNLLFGEWHGIKVVNKMKETKHLSFFHYKEKEGELFSFIIFNVMVDFIYIVTSI